MDFEKVLKKNEPLSSHSTFRVGGPADLFYELTKIDELPELIMYATKHAIPYLLIGRGTNILFTDKGFRGLIIKNLTRNISIDGQTITADSGVLLTQLVRASVEAGLTGMEPLCGVPGTIGAAVWGNAGVPKTETGSFVTELELFNPHDGLRTVPSKDFNFTYRSTNLQKSPDAILRVTLKLAPGNTDASKVAMKNYDEARRSKQPYGLSAGSFFKNPSPEKSAGFLIEQVGMKGEKLGGAQISEKHANFFMNAGGATAADIISLATKAQGAVQERFGILLEREVKFVGDL